MILTTEVPYELNQLPWQSVPSLEHLGNSASDILILCNLDENHVPTGWKGLKIIKTKVGYDCLKEKTHNNSLVGPQTIELHSS